ncbi:HPr family phosphocarrier protein [Glaciecola sp. MH2013]|uniref:HPr family phosphocarrier protein n=1 Tax=Glaciecola sp. MH2013 TaxID=2785524 RepID=UPI00189F7C28|nr:HPr family phosphocarrier protein [Glaciecola sp. MH2013]MBF7074920.1 HPr family phosphocarrier protein [Glaciecola sp. MH2013]
MTLEKKLTIVNKLGLHARAATQLAKLANQFDATITLHQGEKEAFANSVLALMMLESSQGKEVLLKCDGPDAQNALDAIEHLISNKFNEDE